MRLHAACALAAALTLACGADEEPIRRAASDAPVAPPLSLAEAYPGTWQQVFNMPISKALAAGGISGCGQYEYRPAAEGDGFLVRCTADGRTWILYRVASGAVEGPMGNDGSV
jgi:hypothetical protein